MEDLGHNFVQIWVSLGYLIGDLLRLALHWLLLIAWVAWWLAGVNWRRVWPVLARGAWLPLVLLMIASALAWSRLAHGRFYFLGILMEPNFWQQLGGVCLLVAITLFCGWLQGYFRWTPPEIDLSATIPGTGHEHPVGTFHGHEAAHSDDPPEVH